MAITDQQPLGSPFSAATTTEDIVAGHDLFGRTAVVTGGYSGLGLETTRALTAAGAQVIVPARRPDVARAALQEVKGSEVIPMDLADLDSVRSAAAHISDRLDRLDFLMGVAGVMATRERRVGPGWEGQLTANHFGHFTLACELYPLLAAAGARVVVNSSAGHTLTGIRWHDPHFRTGYDKWLAYGQAKTANALFALHLDAVGKGDGVRAFALHPGKIITGLQREMTLQAQIDRGWVDEHGTVIGAGFKTPSQGQPPAYGPLRPRSSTAVAASTWRTATSPASPPPTPPWMTAVCARMPSTPTRPPGSGTCLSPRPAPRRSPDELALYIWPRAHHGHPGPTCTLRGAGPLFGRGRRTSAVGRPAEARLGPCP